MTIEQHDIADFTVAEPASRPARGGRGRSRGIGGRRHPAPAGQRLEPHQGQGPEARRRQLAELRRRLERLHNRYHGDRGLCSTGLPLLDEALAGGLPRGAVHELIALEHAPARTLAFLAARQNAGSAGWIVCIDRAAELFPPALVGLGVSLRRCLIVRPARGGEGLWAAEQALRCSAVAAVILPIREVKPLQLRRLQLAAESGRALLFLLRESCSAGGAGFVTTRLQLEPIAPRCQQVAAVRRVRITVLKARHGPGTSPPIEIELPPGGSAPQ